MPASRLAIGLLAMSLASACSSGADPAADDGRVEVVTSTNVYADIAAAVGGTHATVTSFISSPDQDPHSYEASTRNVLAVSRADVVVENGGGYDDFMDQLLESATGDPVVINAVDISGITAPADGELNEHVWYDLPTMQKLAAALATELGEADPDHARAFEKNADDFTAELQTLIDAESLASHDLAGTPVGITEPVPGYLIDALGLENATPPEFSEAIEEGEDVAIPVLEETLALFSDHQVSALIYNDQTVGLLTEQVEQAAVDADIPVVAVTETLPEGETYVSWMQSNVDAVIRAVSPS